MTGSQFGRPRMGSPSVADCGISGSHRCFLGVTTDGLREELAMCASESNALKTVVITPATPRDIFLSEIHKIFPRIAPLSEIPPLVALHPEFTPLINRMKAIKGMDPTLRSEFIDTKERLKRFPLPPTSGRFAQPMWVEYRDEP